MIWLKQILNNENKIINPQNANNKNTLFTIQPQNELLQNYFPALYIERLFSLEVVLLRACNNLE